MIGAGVEKELYTYMASICNELKCHVHKINGTENHVHIACCLSRTVTMAILLEEVKRSSSKWIKTKGSAYKKFAWQNGYGVFSFGESQLQSVIRYINDQKEHHKNNDKLAQNHFRKNTEFFLPAYQRSKDRFGSSKG